MARSIFPGIFPAQNILDAAQVRRRKFATFLPDSGGAFHYAPKARPFEASWRSKGAHHLGSKFTRLCFGIEDGYNLFEPFNRRGGSYAGRGLALHPAFPLY
jgi:hypothetical protein